MILERVRRSALMRGALIGIACALLCWGLSMISLMQRLDDWFLDTLYILRGSRETKSEVVLVGIDRQTMINLDKPLAWISPELAEVLSYLREQGAEAVAVDLLIPSDLSSREHLKPGAEGDGETVALARFAYGKIVLPQWLIAGEWLRPIYQWIDIPDNWTDLGFVNFTVDPDRIVRRQRLRTPDDDQIVQPHMAVAMLGAKLDLPQDWLVAQKMTVPGTGEPIPLDSSQQLRINYIGPPGSVPVVSFWDVIDASRNPEKISKVAADYWQGKTVIVGVTDPDQADYQPTPYTSSFLLSELAFMQSDRPQELMAGAEIHANVFATLNDRRFITTPWWLSDPLVMILNGAILGMIFNRASLQSGFLAMILHHFFWRGTVLAAFIAADYRVTIVPVYTLGVVLYFVTFGLRWRWMRRMMGMFKSEAIARALEADPTKANLVGEEREISIFFSDVRNFTVFTEGHAAGEVVRLLNRYFAAVVPVIEASGGTINQYMGDGLMVILAPPSINPIMQNVR